MLKFPFHTKKSHLLSTKAFALSLILNTFSPWHHLHHLWSFSYICCLCIIVGNNSHESLGHHLCQIIEGLNHAHSHGHLHLVGSFISNFEKLNLLFNKSILDFCLLVLQYYTCGIDLMNGLHQHLVPLLYYFHHVFMSRRVCSLHPCAFNRSTISCFWNVWISIN